MPNATGTGSGSGHIRLEARTPQPGRIRNTSSRCCSPSTTAPPSSDRQCRPARPRTRSHGTNRPSPAVASAWRWATSVDRGRSLASSVQEPAQVLQQQPERSGVISGHGLADPSARP
jgi:hypothetical protein